MSGTFCDSSSLPPVEVPASPSILAGEKIKSDRSIVQPKSSLLADNPQKFIGDLLKNELLARFEKGLGMDLFHQS